MEKTHNKHAWWFLIIAGLGFLDALYLAVEHFMGAIPPCSIVSGCEEVLTSSFATVGGVPLALLGALYYLSVLVLAIVFFDTKRARVLRFVAWMTTIGFFVSLGLVYLQLFVLDAICLYCMGSALSSTLLFIGGMHLLAVEKKEKSEVEML